MVAMFFDGSNFANNLVKLFQILTRGFGEDFLRISLCPYSAKSPPPLLGGPCFSTDQNFANNLVKLFQILTSGFGEVDFLRISSYSAKSPPHHSGHVFRRIKISRTSFEKGHPRNIPLKLFQNRTRGFGEIGQGISEKKTFL